MLIHLSVCILLINAIAVLSEDRFLARSTNQPLSRAQAYPRTFYLTRSMQSISRPLHTIPHSVLAPMPVSRPRSSIWLRAFEQSWGVCRPSIPTQPDTYGVDLDYIPETNVIVVPLIFVNSVIILYELILGWFKSCIWTHIRHDYKRGHSRLF